MLSRSSDARAWYDDRDTYGTTPTTSTVDRRWGLVTATVDANAPVVTTTKSLLPNGSVATSHQLSDGLLRPCQNGEGDRPVSTTRRPAGPDRRDRRAVHPVKGLVLVGGTAGTQVARPAPPSP
ncbi:hypothetical protein [Streptomyces lincolnensis]|uniref:hypothetical protein n=1 Tax=Streptomyces lincolnensis TaxID=1915 RepID=UPI0037D7B3AF